MKYKEFEEQVTEKVLGLYGEGYTAHIDDGIVENGTGKRSLFIAKAGETCAAPVVFLDEYYRLYEDGKDMDEIAGVIYGFLRQETGVTGMLGRAVSLMAKWENAKDNVYPVLLSRKRNTKLQEKFASRPWLDLSIFYMVRLETEDDGTSFMRISKHQLMQWGVTEEKVYQQAMCNLKGDGCRLRKMDDIIKVVAESGEFPLSDADGGPEMYVLTNRQAVYGASAILLGADYFQETLQGRSFYVLPSSIHETYW